MLELIPAGIAGVMPGLGLIDVLQRVWDLGRAQRMCEAYELFSRGRLLASEHRVIQQPREGALDPPRPPEGLPCPSATITLDVDSRAYAEFLIDRVLEAVDRCR